MTKIGLPTRSKSVVCCNSAIYYVLVFKSCNFLHINTRLCFLALHWRESGLVPDETLTADILKFKVMQKLAVEA